MFTQPKAFRAAICLFGLFIMAVGCGHAPTAPDGSPAFFRWTIDGQEYSASENGLGALRSGGGTCSPNPCLPKLWLTGANCQIHANLDIQIAAPSLSVGTWLVPASFGSGEGVYATYTPNASSGTAAETAWRSYGGIGGSGSVTLTTVTEDWVSGSFDLLLVAGGGNASGTKSIQGAFNLRVKDSRIC